MDIVAILKNHGAIGKDNAITTDQLKIIMVAKEKREVTRAVELARDNGDIICSRMNGEGGYYLPATLEESKSYLKTQGSRLKKSVRRYQKAKRQILTTEESAHQGNLFNELGVI